MATSGAGAAGIAIIKLLVSLGLKTVIMCDRKGAIYEGRGDLNAEKEEMAKISNRGMEKGSLADVLKGADVFIGVSAPGTVTEEMVKTMAPNPILFPMANPVPEIMPDLAKAAGAAVVGHSGQTHHHAEQRRGGVNHWIQAVAAKGETRSELRHQTAGAGVRKQAHVSGYPDRSSGYPLLCISAHPYY